MTHTTARHAARGLIGAALLAAVLGGCTRGGDTADAVDVGATSETVPTESIAAREPTTATTAEATTTTTTATAAPTTTWAGSATSIVRDQPAPTVPGPAEAVLRGDGLGPVDFGTAEGDALARLQQVLGPVDVTEHVASWCDGGPAMYAQWNAAGINVTFLDGVIAGWSLRDGSNLRTTEGIGAGSTVAAVRAAFGDRFAWVPESTLGHEFTIRFDPFERANGTWASLSGVSSAATEQGTVEAVWGGANCTAR